MSGKKLPYGVSSKKTPYDTPTPLTDRELEEFKRYCLKCKTIGQPVPTINRFGTLLSFPVLVPQVTLKGYVKALDAGCFAQHPTLRKITLPEGIKIIPRWCFSDCQELEEVVLPETVEFVEFGAFSGCPMLEKQHIGNRLWGFVKCVSDPIPDPEWDPPLWDRPDCSVYCGYDGERVDRCFCHVLLNDFGELRDYPSQAGAFAYHGSLDYYRTLAGNTSLPVIPSNGSFEDFRRAFQSARRGTFLGAVISEGFTEIPSGAFAGLEGFKAVWLPSTVQVIRTGAFRDCRDLRYLNLHRNVTVEPGAFEGCAHIAWMDPEDLFGDGRTPAEEMEDMLRAVLAAAAVQDVIPNSWEFRYLKDFLERLWIPDTALYQEARSMANCLKKRLDNEFLFPWSREHSNFVTLTPETRQLFVVSDPALRDAVRQAVRYDLRYLQDDEI